MSIVAYQPNVNRLYRFDKAALSAFAASNHPRLTDGDIVVITAKESNPLKCFTDVKEPAYVVSVIKRCGKVHKGKDTKSKNVGNVPHRCLTPHNE